MYEAERAQCSIDGSVLERKCVWEIESRQAYEVGGRRLECSGACTWGRGADVIDAIL
jgi:hypothetical protein